MIEKTCVVIGILGLFQTSRSSDITRKPISSVRSMKTLAGGLWAVRMALLHGLEKCQLPPDGIGMNGGPQRAKVMVQANALQLHVPAVQEKAIVGSRQWSGSQTGILGIH